MSDDGLLVRESRGKYVWLSIAEDRRDGILDLLR
jgi:hypothetical protein